MQNDNRLIEETASGAFDTTTVTFKTSQISALAIQTTVETSGEETCSVVTDLGSVTVNVTDPEDITDGTASTVLQESSALATSGSQTETSASIEMHSTDSSTSEVTSDHASETTQATIENQVPTGGSSTSDLTNSGDALLGVVQSFHIFANQASLNAHTNGNLAVGFLTGHVNFGTSIHDGALHQEINYIQQVTQIANSSFVSATSNRSNKVIFGSGVTLGLEDQNHQAAVYVNGQRMDHLRTSEVYQDAETPSIDFGSVFQTLATTSETLQGLEQTSGVNTDFSDNDRSTIVVGQSAIDQLSDSLPVVLTLTDENG